MKYRSDFVTNSSSSSFIVNFKNKQEMQTAFERMQSDAYTVDYAYTVFEDIKNNRITFKEALAKILEEAQWDIERQYYRLDSLNLKYSSFNEYIASEEYKKTLKEHLCKVEERFRNSVNSRGIFAEIYYCDHTDLGSCLEHKIMPSLPFVVKSFNNH